VWGRQMPAAASLRGAHLPLGLANKLTLTRDVAEGRCLTWSDVAANAGDDALRVRREMEKAFGAAARADT
jgi:predicted homoserine dehydrogenase-like protein